MTSLWSSAVRAVVVAGVLAHAAAPAQSQIASPGGFQVLTAADVPPAQVLPPPPTDGGEVTRVELAELRRIAKTTTHAAWKQAAWDDEHEDATIFQSAIGPGYDLAALPTTARLMAEVRREEAAAAGLAKNYFNRTRPWILDASLRTCSRGDAPQSSYPSGHATMAFAMASVLADV